MILTSDDTVSDINSGPYLSTEEVKLSLMESELDTLKEESIDEEIPESDAGEDQLNKGESEEVVPPKDSSVPKETDIVPDIKSSEEVDGRALPEPNNDVSKESEDNNVDENASKRQKVVYDTSEDVESETTPKTADSMSDIEPKKNSPSYIPSVTQSGQLFSKAEVSKATTEDVSKPATEDVLKPTTEDVSKPTNDDVSKPTTEDVSKPTSEDVSKPTNEDVSKPTNDDVSKPTTEEVPADDKKPSPPVVEREISTEERHQM